MDAGDISISAVHDATGLSRSTVGRMASGRCTGSLHSWMLVSNALGIPVDYVLGGDMGDSFQETVERLYDQSKVDDAIHRCAEVAGEVGLNRFETWKVFQALEASSREMLAGK